MDKLTAMTTFVTVVDSGSFTRAAEILDVPKARISQRITDLENVLGVRLLYRTTRALSLSEDGQAYLERCRHILSEISDLEDALQGGRSMPSGMIRIDVLASIARWIIAPRLHVFHEKFPRIAIRFGSSDRVSNLHEEGIDCAIRGGSLEDSSIVAKHVADIYFGLYAAPAYLAASRPVLTPEDLMQHKRISWFNPRRGSRFTWHLVRKSDEFILKKIESIQFDDPDTAIAACIAGAGISPAAPFAVESYVRSGLLVPVLPEWHFQPRPIHIVYPAQKHLSTRIRSFVDWSQALLQSSETLHLKPIELASGKRGG